ncbi:MAG: hypothetical protein AAB221_01010, partial [Bacteroidota bacterium]
VHTFVFFQIDPEFQNCHATNLGFLATNGTNDTNKLSKKILRTQIFVFATPARLFIIKNIMVRRGLTQMNTDCSLRSKCFATNTHKMTRKIQE